jgi:ubiquinone/menaquinone biosynthesis C-methylase UbiE
LFTKRNLLSLALLWQSINTIPNEESRNFLRFTFSSALKWASRQSHRRGNIIEGWAMHAYWLYPKELEINVWNTFARRFIAVTRGKRFTNLTISDYYQKADSFTQLSAEQATCLILTQSSTSLPIPENSVDAIITDPPYGGNVNYAELADYWSIWHRFDSMGVINKSQEVIINEHQHKSLSNYEELLEQVFTECYRVLKPQGVCVVTFNNRDLSVVAAFIEAVTKAGFVLHPEGLLYQPPIKAYATTFHAKDLGAFTGDFVFTFCKEKHQPILAVHDRNVIKQQVEQAILQFLECPDLHRHTQADLRQQLYRILLPFLASYANRNDDTYWEVIQELRQQLRSLDKFLPEIRTWCRNRYGINFRREEQESHDRKKEHQQLPNWSSREREKVKTTFPR